MTTMVMRRMMMWVGGDHFVYPVYAGDAGRVDHFIQKI